MALYPNVMAFATMSGPWTCKRRHVDNHSQAADRKGASMSFLWQVKEDNPTDNLSPSPNSRRSAGVVAVLFPLSVLLIPLVVGAIDHPVDHATLGIPIPVPDARYFVSGGLCAAASHGIATPIDVVKTRIQSEPDVFNQGLVSATQAIVEQDGVSALLGGLGPTVVGYALEGAMKFGLYESLKPTFAQLLPSNDVVVAYLGASVVAGAVASVLLCPMEHTRIRLVTDPTFASGLVSVSQRYAVTQSNVFDARQYSHVPCGCWCTTTTNRLLGFHG